MLASMLLQQRAVACNHDTAPGHMQHEVLFPPAKCCWLWLLYVGEPSDCACTKSGQCHAHHVAATEWRCMIQRARLSQTMPHLAGVCGVTAALVAVVAEVAVAAGDVEGNNHTVAPAQIT